MNGMLPGSSQSSEVMLNSGKKEREKSKRKCLGFGGFSLPHVIHLLDYKKNRHGLGVYYITSNKRAMSYHVMAETGEESRAPPEQYLGIWVCAYNRGMHLSTVMHV